jgi:hypothetical protein
MCFGNNNTVGGGTNWAVLMLLAVIVVMKRHHKRSQCEEKQADKGQFFCATHFVFAPARASSSPGRIWGKAPL